MNAFHVLGATAAVWAVIVGALGIRSDRFPGGRGERIVIAISIVLVMAAIGSALITAANEAKHEEAEEAEAALFLPRAA